MANDLQRGRSQVNLTGKVRLSDSSFSGEKTSERTGYKYKQIRFGVEIAEGYVVYCELSGGYSPSNPIVFSQDKDNNRLELAWTDRLNEKILENVADYRFNRVGLTRDENGRLEVKRFISPFDTHDYLKENLKEGMEVTVRGSNTFSEYNDDVQRRIQIQSVFLPFQEKKKDIDGNETGELLPVTYEARAVQTVLITEDSFKRISSKDEEAGEVIVRVKAVDYVGKKDGKEIKKNMPFTIPLTVKLDNRDLAEKMLDKLFNVKRGVIRELTIEATIMEGYDQSEIKTEDVQHSAEIQELIDLGIYSAEEMTKKMVVRGNRVSKLIFDRPFVQKDRDTGALKIEIDDNKYEPADLVVEVEDNSEEQLGMTDGGNVSEDDVAAALNFL